MVSVGKECRQTLLRAQYVKKVDSQALKKNIRIISLSPYNSPTKPVLYI